MLYRRLGKSGLKLSRLSFGSWVTFGTQVNTKQAKELLGIAFDNGVNFFDNAEVYAGGESEIIMGQALTELALPRDAYCLSSKVFWGGQLPTQRGLSRKHLFDACHAALWRLQTEYLDLFFCHRPDVETPIEETVWAMNHLIQQGKILYWGTSEWSAQQITEAFAFAAQNHLIGPTMEQPQYNLFHRDRVEREYAPLYRTYGLGTTIWSPLASGILTGKYQNGIPAGSRATLSDYGWLKARLNSEEGHQQLEQARALAGVAGELGMSLAQLAIAWCAHHPNVSTVILGASQAHQLEENLQAIRRVDDFDKSTIDTIESIVNNKPEPEQSY